jgi:hypothetical protein
MPVGFGASVTVIEYQWTAFKSAVATKNLTSLMQYYNDGTTYNIFVFDGSLLALTCNIWQATVPAGIIASGYSQAQNNTDLTDFTTNYQASANKRISNCDKFGNPVTVEFSNAVVMSPPPGVTGGVINGYVGTSATSGVPVRATAYTAQGSGAQRSVKSSSANDTSAGTGAQKIIVTYLDTTLSAYLTETITMNGTTAVNTVGTTSAFLERMDVSQTGTLTGNAGTISIFTTTAGGGSVWGTMAAQDNQTYWAHHYVLAGQTCYLGGLVCGATAVPGQITIQVQGNPTATNLPQKAVGSTYLHGSESGNTPMVDHEFFHPLPIAGPNFFWLSERPNAVTASTAYGSFEYSQF